MATINLGNLTFTHKGDYAGGTAYVKNDVVYYATNGNAYIAKQATTGNAPTSTAHWDVFAAGSGGIWNAGLSLGSAGQSVKVNAAGNALEFGTISSDYVKLASTNITSDTTEIDFLSVFSTDYEFFKIYLSVYPSTTNSNINFRAITGTNTVDSSGGSYFQLGNQPRMTTGGSNDSPAHYGSHNHGEVYLTYPAGNGAGTGADYGAFSVIEIARPWDSANAKWGHTKNIYRDNAGKITMIQGGFAYRLTTAMTGFRIYGSTFNRGRVSVYGIKH